VKIAIIGGSGTIGENLLKKLLKTEHKIISTYSNKHNIKNNKIFWKKLDIYKNKKNFYKYLESPDIVVNLAWPNIPNYKLKKHFKTYKYQKRFNYNLINNGLKNLIVLGTCYEYGKINNEIFENTKPKPIIPYSISKLKLLEKLQNFKKRKNFKLTWLRPFFVYGLNKKRKTLFTLIKELEKNKIKKLQVSGSLIRDFISMDFLSEVIIKIINLNKGYGVVNVSTGKGISVKEFIKKNLKKKSTLKKIDMNGINKNDFEPSCFWGNNLKLKRILKKK
tara:strand:+ start:93 stop:923 length:831 start_codon:yes stop_codon:yes gene_type:complete